jgi:hypothetical protein
VTAFRTAAGPVAPDVAAERLTNLGFLAVADLPDRPGPGLLLVALRDRPTLRHFDPERIDFWVAQGARGVRRTLGRTSALPLAIDFSWGQIRLVDRLLVTNEYLAFGGTLAADRVDDTVLVRFVSPAPILRGGGHSQGIDQGAEALGGWFGRIRLATTSLPGFEARLAATEPLGLYAAFLQDETARLSSSPAIRAVYGDLACLLRVEADRLRDEQPAAWLAGTAIEDDLSRAAGGGTPAGSGSR